MSIVALGPDLYQDTDTYNIVSPYGSGTFYDGTSGAILDSTGRVVGNTRTGIGVVPTAAPNAAPSPPNPSGPNGPSALDAIGGFLSSLAAPAASVTTSVINANAQRSAGARGGSIVLGGAPTSSLGTVVLVGGIGLVAVVLYFVLKK